MDPYDSYMASQYAGYQPQASPASTLSSFIPGAQLGLSAVGLLSSIYGGYKAQQQAARNFREQRHEYQDQKQLTANELAYKHGQDALANAYAAKNSAESDADSLYKKYAGYYRGIGL
jgi:type VI protein secretion system component VasK